MNRNFRRIVANILSIIAILALAFPMTGSAFAQDEPSPFNLKIRAYIDGYSQLVIQGGNAHWHHLGAAAPGRWLFVDLPTYLNETEWLPTWPDYPDAENRDCNCDSSTFSGLNPALPADEGFGFQIVQARNSVSISQQPTAENDHTLIIDFDDGPPSGAEWYEVVLIPASAHGEHIGGAGYGHPNGCNAFGWVQPFDGSTSETLVRILADGAEVASGETSRQRFNFNLWGQISNYEDHLIEVQAYDQVYDQWLDLNFTPHTLHCTNYDIFILNTRDGTVERLTTLEDTGEYNPSWSPDGQKIVHDVTNADFHALYITDIKTHKSDPLTGGDGGNDASWSPNGKWIVFDRSPYDDPNLYILPPAGGTPKPVVQNATNGDWSPDNLRLVFQRDDGIYTASAKGGDEKQIVPAGYNPVWSPNGLWIAYDYEGNIYKVRVNKSGARIGDPIAVTSDPAYEGGATWSQDNRQIAFSSDASGDQDIWQISAEGGTPVRLVRTSIYGDYDPDYSGNGQYIAYDGAIEPSQPYIAAFPDWGYIEAQDWPMNDTVHLMIDDPATEINPDYEAEQPTVATSWGNWWAQFNFDYDLKIGDRVTETDGYLTRSYTVRPVDVIDANQNTDAVSGTAEPGAMVYVWAWDHEESYREIIAASDGTWVADYSTADFMGAGTCGRAEVRDKIGNRTAIDWCVRNPRIVASESGNWFWTTDFRQGILSISIYETADQNAPLLWSGQQEADHGGFIILDPNTHGLDLVPGNYLVITDGVYQKELVLQPITINVFDTANEVMTGTAPVGSEVWAAAGPQDWQARILAKAVPMSGTWLADFKAVDFDITEEMRPWSYAHIYDEDGDANEGSTPPPARVVVQITDNWFRAEQFAPNAELTYWVYDAKDGNLIFGPEAAQTDNDGLVYVDVGVDLVPGNYLVVTDGAATKDIVLEPFTFHIDDLNSGLLKGTALPSGRAVWVGIGWLDQDAWIKYVPSDENGAWIADFGTSIPDGYWWMAAQIFDPDGDASEIRPSPPPRIVVQITDDWFRAENFTPNGELTFWVYDANGNLLRHPDRTWTLDANGYITVGMLELDDYINLVPGYRVVVSDGVITKDIVLEAFTFDTFNLTNGQLSGTAPEPYGRDVWVGIGWQDQDAWTTNLTTDGIGAWMADFEKPVPDDYWWVAAQIFDADGDASELRPGQIIYESP